MKNRRDAYLSFRLKVMNRLARKEVFGSFAEALSKCGLAGCNDEDIVRAVCENTAQLKNDGSISGYLAKYHTSAYSTLIEIIDKIGKKEVSVLDFGGASGGYYFAVRSRIDPGRKLKWCVAETENMCRHNKRFKNEELDFFDDLEAAKSHMQDIDIVNVSGSIQYTDEPYRFLGAILAGGAKYIIFSRMCFTAGDKDIITIQKSMLSWHIAGELPAGIKDKEIRCPFTAIRKSEFDAMVRQRYEYEKMFADDSGIIRVNNEPTFGLGLLCKRKNS